MINPIMNKNLHKNPDLLTEITLKYIPVGIAYALWAGLGIIFITIVGLVVFGQKLDSAAIIGLTMIILGIVVIHLFSSTSSH